jgi:hypothetical protein
MMVSELVMQMLDRTIGRLIRHLAALALALEVKLNCFRASHDSLPPK